MQKEPSVGQKVIEALTEEQLAHLLDVLLDRNHEVLWHKLPLLDQETARTVEHVVTRHQAGSAEDQTPCVLSRDKLKEVWDGLWERWNRVMAQLGDDEGSYSVQEVHWEPPYFDGFSLSRDLEEIAEQMLPYLERAFESFHESELFSGALIDIEESIAEYPEWMSVEHEEPVTLGPCATQCLLQWIWKDAGLSEDQGWSFLDSLKSLFNTLEMIELDAPECGRFVASLPVESAQKVYQHFEIFRENTEREVLVSPWIHLRDALNRRFCHEDYLATCKAHLDSNWLYGLDIIDDSMSKQDYASAEAWLSKTSASYFLMPIETGWLPEQSLFIDHAQLISLKEHEDIDRLFQAWITVEHHLENSLRCAAAELQRAVFKYQFQIDRVLDACKASMETSETRQTLEPLLQAWKDHLAFLSGFTPDTEGTEADWSWLHWLIEARREGEDQEHVFQTKIQGWLQQLAGKPERIRSEYDTLSCLTLDLNHISEFDQGCPMLIHVLDMDNPGYHLDEELTSERQALLSRFASDGLVQLTMHVWESCLHLLVPDPSTARKSNYMPHAKWLKALEEVNPSACQAVLQTWQQTHRRRRNLWQALRETGLNAETGKQ